MNKLKSLNFPKKKTLLIAVFILCSSAPLSGSMHTLVRTLRWFVAVLMNSIVQCLAKLFTVSFRFSKNPGIYFLSSARRTGQKQQYKGEIS